MSYNSKKKFEVYDLIARKIGDNIYFIEKSRYSKSKINVNHGRLSELLMMSERPLIHA